MEKWAPVINFFLFQFIWSNFTYCFKNLIETIGRKQCSTIFSLKKMIFFLIFKVSVLVKNKFPISWQNASSSQMNIMFQNLYRLALHITALKKAFN